MTFLSRVLIRVVGTRNYLRIPRRLRHRLGMVCGDDHADLKALLRQLQAARPSDKVA